MGVHACDRRDVATLEQPDWPTAHAPTLRSATWRRWLGAILISGAFAAVLLTIAPPELIVDYFRNLRPRTLVGPFLWLVLGGLLRAERLRILLTSRPPLGKLYALTQLDKLVGAALPGGLSEAVSAWAMRSVLNTPIHLGLMALLVGRVFDVFVLLSLALFVVGSGLVALEAYSSLLQGSAIVLLSAIVALGYVHLRSPRLLATLLNRFAAMQRSPSRTGNVLRRALELVSEAIDRLPSDRRIVPIIALTLGMHFTNVQAVRILLAGEGLDFGFPAGIAIFVTFVLLRMLPVQGLGGIGTTAAWWAIALAALGVPAQQAIVVGTVLFIAFYVLLSCLCLTALPFFWLGRRSRRDG